VAEGCRYNRGSTKLESSMQPYRPAEVEAAARAHWAALDAFRAAHEVLVSEDALKPKA